MVSLACPLASAPRQTMASVAGAVRALPLRRWNLPVRSGTRPPRPSVCEASSHEHDAELMRKPQWSKYMHVNGCVGWAIDAPGRVHRQFDPVRSEQILLYGQLLGLSRLHVGPGSVPRTPSRAPCPDAPAGRRCPAAAPLLMRTRGAGAPKPTRGRAPEGMSTAVPLNGAAVDQAHSPEPYG